MNKFLIRETTVTSTATIRRVGGTRGEDETGRDHDLVIFASVVLAVLGFSGLLDGMAAISRAHAFVSNAHYAGKPRIWGWSVLILAVLPYGTRPNLAAARPAWRR